MRKNPGIHLNPPRKAVHSWLPLIVEILIFFFPKAACEPLVPPVQPLCFNARSCLSQHEFQKFFIWEIFFFFPT